MIYLIGDIQGCFNSFQKLLEEINFSTKKDTIYLLGDLVNRGPNSLEVLKFCFENQNSIKIILGNHDLHLLACYYKIRELNINDTLNDILNYDDKDVLIKWLITQPFLISINDKNQQKLLMVHAGILPNWNLEDCLKLSKEMEDYLKNNPEKFLKQIFIKSEVNYWKSNLDFFSKLRVVINAFTRIRFITKDGVMNFEEKMSISSKNLIPWFDCQNRKTENIIVAFGHWATLGLINKNNLISLDTGCVWGGKLTAVAINENNFSQRKIYQIDSVN